MPSEPVGNLAAIEREIDAATKARAEAIMAFTDAEFRLKATNRRYDEALEARTTLTKSQQGD